MNERWGFVADLGHHETGNDLLETTTYRFGPKLSNRVGTRVKTFGQFLVAVPASPFRVWTPQTAFQC